jgi:hypothetical protein
MYASSLMRKLEKEVDLMVINELVSNGMLDSFTMRRISNVKLKVSKRKSEKLSREFSRRMRGINVRSNAKEEISVLMMVEKLIPILIQMKLVIRKKIHLMKTLMHIDHAFQQYQIQSCGKSK